MQECGSGKRWRVSERDVLRYGCGTAFSFSALYVFMQRTAKNKEQKRRGCDTDWAKTKITSTRAIVNELGLSGSLVCIDAYGQERLCPNA